MSRAMSIYTIANGDPPIVAVPPRFAGCKIVAMFVYAAASDTPGAELATNIGTNAAAIPTNPGGGVIAVALVKYTAGAATKAAQ